MNRIIPSLCFGFLLASCNLPEDNTILIENAPEEKPQLNTTAMILKPVPLMLPFHLDSVFINDSNANLQAGFYFPVSEHPHYRTCNKLAYELVSSELKNYESKNRKQEEPVSLQVWVSEMAVNQSLVSFCFTGQSFTQGAAHYNHYYSTLNYNTIIGEQVFLNDIFSLETSEQQTAFCALVNPDEKGLGANLLETDDLKTVADFIIQNGQLIFYFDDYEKGPSMEKRSFELNAFRDFVRPEYRFLLTD